tara:strand:- start:91 stop:456 length:366 start_codon:yes stop_codon:yes gene_type:complete
MYGSPHSNQMQQFYRFPEEQTLLIALPCVAFDFGPYVSWLVDDCDYPSLDLDNATPEGNNPCSVNDSVTKTSVTTCTNTHKHSTHPASAPEMVASAYAHLDTALICALRITTPRATWLQWR